MEGPKIDRDPHSKDFKTRPYFFITRTPKKAPNFLEPAGKTTKARIVDGCQNYGLLLGPANTGCRITIRSQKGTINLTTTHIRPFGS